jgi:hypothetical protein
MVIVLENTRKCGLKSKMAIICRCEALVRQRYKFFGKLFFEPKDKSGDRINAHTTKAHTTIAHR